MARPQSISTEHLLQVAKEAFLEQGFFATTAEIARRAGVSEGTLFARFGSKEDLFEQALGLSGYGGWRSDLLACVGVGDARLNLERHLMAYLCEAQTLVPAVALVLSRGYDHTHNPLLERLGNPAGRDVQALADYLRAEAALGRLRPLDAEVAALAVNGALTQYISQQVMSGGCTSRTDRRAAPPPDPARFVRSLMDLWWPGLAPAATATRHTVLER